MYPPIRRSTLFPYACAVLFVGIWWIVAFLPRGFVENHDETLEAPQKICESLEAPYLASLSRSRLHKALLGDVDLMAGLIAEWDAEAELLEQSEVTHARRLPKDQFLRAQTLTHRIRRRHSGLTDPYLADPRLVSQTKQDSPSPQYLPQTYVAASFLLALTSPDQIMALPSEMRRITQLYPSELTRQIKLALSPYNTQRLWEARPAVAFIASYSQPATCAALRQQGIELCTLSDVTSIEQVQSALLQVGSKVGREEEAELLALFMDAALCALDNRLMLHQQTAPEVENVLYVNYYSSFTAPSQRTLTGKLLKRLRINELAPLQAQGHSDWQIPLTQEQLQRCEPDRILLSCAQSSWLRHQLLTNPSMHSLPAVRNGRIYALDPEVQNSPSQFAILAYFDLVHSLMQGVN